MTQHHLCYHLQGCAEQGCGMVWCGYMVHGAWCGMGVCGMVWYGCEVHGAWCGMGVRGMGAWCGAVAVRDQVVCGRLSLHRSYATYCGNCIVV